MAQLRFPSFRPTTAVLAPDVQVNLRSGAASLSVPIPRTDGRNGLAPNLALSYLSGGTNSVFGVGWELSGVPSFGIDTRKHVPTYRHEGDRYDFAGQEVVPRLRTVGSDLEIDEEVRNGFRIERWRSTVEEAYERVERWVEQSTGRVHWRTMARDGTISIYGLAADNSTRIANPEDPAQTFRWLLEATYDRRGNAVRFEYKAETTDGVTAEPWEIGRLAASGHAQRYLKRILYANSLPTTPDVADPAGLEWHLALVFDYGEHGEVGQVPTWTEDATWKVRPDPFSRYRAGFEVRTWRRCHRVIQFHRFGDLGTEPVPVRATEWEYQLDAPDSVIETVRHRGYRHDVTPVAELATPPLVMTYTPAELGTSFETLPVDSLENLPVGIDGLVYRWVDLEGDGLPGVLYESKGAWWFKENLGDGEFGPSRLVDEIPTRVAATLSLRDFDNDGNLDFVSMQGREAGYFTRDLNRGRWGLFQALKEAPKLDWRNARVQMADLNGDGFLDMVVDRQDHFVWYPSVGKDEFDSPRVVSKPVPRTGGVPALNDEASAELFFADMTGDGAADIVRVTNGTVEYWPNMGQGAFGRVVQMGDAPWFSDDQRFDPRRLRLADLDGSGTTDLLYLGRGELRVWHNHGGNRFGEEIRVGGLPVIDNASSARILDLLGTGTQCLVFSTLLPGTAPLQYLPLTASKPPRLLQSVHNSLGRETHLHWRSSAVDYLRDKAAFRPWRTALPRHRMVLDRIEAVDTVSDSTLTQVFAWRDGYFDSHERSFAGFGQVEVTDAEVIANSGDADYSPPLITRTWFHTGEVADPAQQRRDWYDGDAEQAFLPQPTLLGTQSTPTDAFYAAHRALAGKVARREVFGVTVDGLVEPHPQSVTQTAYRIEPLQPALGIRSQVHGVVKSEELHHEYGGAPSDPRVTHSAVTETDEYGNVTQAVQLAYPRRAGPDTLPEQQVLQATAEALSFVHVDDPSSMRFEVGFTYEIRAFDLAGLTAVASHGVLTFDELTAQLATALAAPIDFDDDYVGAGPEARLRSWNQSYFWDDTQTGALSLGQVGDVVLLHHAELAVYPTSMGDAVYAGRLTSTEHATDTGFVSRDGYWWSGGSTTYHLQGSDFYVPDRAESPGGALSDVTFDDARLVVVAEEDAFSNRTEAEIDYHVLVPNALVDPNGNRTETRYDPLGVRVASTWHGTRFGEDGASHRAGFDTISDWNPGPGTTWASVLADPSAFVDGMAWVAFLDLEAHERGDGPPRYVEISRVLPVDDGEGGVSVGTGEVQIRVQYLDGFGRELQTRVRVDDGLAISRDASGSVEVDSEGAPILAHSTDRWWVSGHVARNNRGWPIRNYEPFYSEDDAFEGDEVLQTFGVATETRFDASGRPVRVDQPLGTSETVVHTPWLSEKRDANDNVSGSDYEAERSSLPTTDPERVALDKASAHANTPTRDHVDPSGRVFRIVEVGEAGLERATTTTLDSRGDPLVVVDARGVTAFGYQRDMLGRVLVESSADAGTTTVLFDEDGRVVRSWDARDIHTHHVYDAEGRPLRVEVIDGAGVARVHERYLYGEDSSVSDARDNNQLGRLVERMDGAGVLTVERYSQQGQELASTLQLVDDYTSAVDWTTPSSVTLQAQVHSTSRRLDALARTLREELPDQTTRTCTYNRLGEVSRVGVTTGDGALDDVAFVEECDYNARRQRTRLRFGNGVESSYSYDERTWRLKRLLTERYTGPSETFLDVRYTTDPVGNIVHWVDHAQEPGGSTLLITGLTVSSACEFTYDAWYQLVEATGRVSQALLQHDYRFGFSVGSAVKGSQHITLANGAAVERYTREYTYDLAGNLTKLEHRGTTSSWTTDKWVDTGSNRQGPANDIAGLPIANPELRFDGAGNCTELPHLRSLTFDDLGRLSHVVVIDRSATGDPNDEEFYVYDAGGRRVRRVTHRLVSGQLEVAETTYLDQCELRTVSLAGTVNLVRSTSRISTGDTQIASLHQWTQDDLGSETSNINDKRIHYQVGNHLGSVSLELDDSGGVISYEEYFPFGGTSFVAGDSVKDVRIKEYRYSGKVRDDMTGLYYYTHRYYAPWIGNWVSPDPSGQDGGANLFRFVENNPIRLVDPEGLEPADAQGVPATSVAVLPPEVWTAINSDPEKYRQFIEDETHGFWPNGEGGYDYGTREQLLAWREKHAPETSVGVFAMNPLYEEVYGSDPETLATMVTLHAILDSISGESAIDGLAGGDPSGEDGTSDTTGDADEDSEGGATDGLGDEGTADGGGGDADRSTGKGPGTKGDGPGEAGQGSRTGRRGPEQDAGGTEGGTDDRDQEGHDTGTPGGTGPPTDRPSESEAPLDEPEVTEGAAADDQAPDDAKSPSSGDRRGVPGNPGASHQESGQRGTKDGSSEQKEAQEGGTRERPRDVLDTLVDIASYISLDAFFGDDPDVRADDNGIPGGMGLLDLGLGRWTQVAYVGIAVYDLITTIATLGESKVFKEGLKKAAMTMLRESRQLAREVVENAGQLGLQIVNFRNWFGKDKHHPVFKYLIEAMQLARMRQGRPSLWIRVQNGVRRLRQDRVRIPKELHEELHELFDMLHPHLRRRIGRDLGEAPGTSAARVIADRILAGETNEAKIVATLYRFQRTFLREYPELQRQVLDSIHDWARRAGIWH